MTQTQIRCLLAIWALSGHGQEALSKDVSKVLGVSRPSVHRMLEILCREGLALKKPYGAVRLSAQGEAAARALEARKERLQLFFCRLGLPLDEGAAAATLLMSALREESLAHLEALSEAQTQSGEGKNAESAVNIHGIPVKTQETP